MIKFVVTNTQHGANLRAQPTVSSAVIRNLPFGTLLVLDEDTGTKWKKVTVNGGPHDGATGFVSDVNLTVARSPAVASLLGAAAHYWTLFDRGNGKENVQPFKNFVLTMWDELPASRPPNDDTSHPNFPWSAVGMSAFVRKAASYPTFKASSGHHRYIKDSVRARFANDNGAPFWGFRLTERKPEVGDLVVQWRQVPRSFDFVRSVADSDTTFKSHTDLVCEVKDGFLWSLGCNNGHSVARKRYRLDGNGHLRAENRTFMLMKNVAAA